MARGLTQILACMPFALAAAAGLPEPTDLRSEAPRMAREGLPMVVLFSQSECHWCEEARTYLVPMAQGEGSAKALFRQINLDSDAALADFAGHGTTQRAFARAEGVRFAPTVAVYGAGGEQLVEPIVGMRLADFYGQYVDQAIAAARQRMRETNE